MLRDGNFNRIIICCGRTDLRRGASGLAAYVEVNYGLNAFEKGTLFLFCGRRTDRIKALLYEGDGFLLLYKRLADGRFRWPRSAAEVRDITPEQYGWLMDGLEVPHSFRLCGSGNDPLPHLLLRRPQT